jgi:UDP-2,4-diacetamido-2,4,6-trideoxy-beta-L-altropyranose hydrolase
MNTAANKIVIRVDGNKGFGMGHLYRMLALAGYLRDRYGFDVLFVVRNNRAAIELVGKEGFRIYSLRYNASREEELKLIRRMFAAERPDVLVVDLLKRCRERSFMKKLKSSGEACIIAISDVHEKTMIESHIAILLSHFQKAEYYEQVKDTKYYVGVDYVMLPPSYLSLGNKLRKTRDHVERVMVCMGGADQHNLTFTVLKAIDMSSHDFSVDIVVNSSFFQKDEVDCLLRDLRHDVKVHYDLKGIMGLLQKADIVISSGGTVHVERMCVGTPGIVINQLLHQAVLSRKVSEMGASLDLGMYRDVSAKDIKGAFDMLLEDKALRERMTKRGRKYVDGKGLQRVSEIIAKACERSVNNKRVCAHGG